MRLAMRFSHCMNTIWQCTRFSAKPRKLNFSGTGGDAAWQTWSKFVATGNVRKRWLQTTGIISWCFGRLKFSSLGLKVNVIEVMSSPSQIIWVPIFIFNGEAGMARSQASSLVGRWYVSRWLLAGRLPGVVMPAKFEPLAFKTSELVDFTI